MARPNKGPRLEYNGKRGVYEIRWTEQRDGQSRSRRLSTGTGTLQEAQGAFAAFLNEWSQDAGEATPTVEKVLNDYLEEHVDRKVADKTRAHDSARFIIQGFGDKLVSELDQATIDRYVRARKSGTIRGRRRAATQDGTLRRELTTLISAMNHAVRKRRLRSEEVPHLELPEGSPPREFWLTEDEADRLLQIAAEESEAAGRLTRVHRYLLLGLGTAARMNAILGLTWDRVDLGRRLVRYDIDNSGQRTGSATKKRRVPVPIADWLLPYLEQAYQEREGDYVLDHPGNIRREWDRFIERAVEQTGNTRYRQLNRHGLRHTAATHMARAGVDLWQLAGVLGDTLATVQRNYLHHCPDHLRSAVNFRAPDVG